MTPKSINEKAGLIFKIHLFSQVFLGALIFLFWRRLLPNLGREMFGLLPDYFPLFFCFQFLGFWLIYRWLHRLDVLGSRVLVVDFLSLVFPLGLCVLILFQLYTSAIPLSLTVWGVGFLYSVALAVKSMNLLVHLYSVIDKPQLDKKGNCLVFFTALLILSSYTLWASKRVADGDQTRYLLVSHSLVHDWDLDLKNNYENKDYWPFLPDDDFLRKNAGVVLTDGSIKPGHNVGLSVLLVPGYFLGGKLGAQLEMAFLSAMLACLVYSIVFQVIHDQKKAVWLAFLSLFTVPVFPLSNLIYPEIPAAVIVAFVVYQGFKERSQLFASALCLGLLAWLNVRFVPLVFTLFFYLIISQFRQKRMSYFIQLALMIVVIFICYASFNQRLYNFSSPAGPYFSEPRPARVNKFFDFTYWPRVLYKGTLRIFDQESGFLFYSPWYIFVPLGMYFFLKAKSWKAIGLLPSFIFLYPVSVGVGGLGTGWSPISRYLVVLVPLMVFYLAKLVREAKEFSKSKLFGFFIIYSLGYTAIFSFLPKFSYPRSVSVTRTLSRLTRISFYKILPASYSTPDTKNYLLALGYLLAVVLLNFWTYRRYMGQGEKQKMSVRLKKKVIFFISQARRYVEWVLTALLSNYLLLLFLDLFCPQLITSYWDFDILVWPIGVLGIILVFLSSGVKQDEVEKKDHAPLNYFWIAGLALLGGGIVFLEINTVSYLRWIISILSSTLIVLLCLVVLTEEPRQAV